MRNRRYTEDEFRAAVADPDVRTIADLCRALGIVPRGGNYESVRTYAYELGVDIDRLEPPPTHRQLIDAVPEPDLRRAVADSTSLAATIRALGLPDVASARAALGKRVGRLDIDTSHFTSWRPATRRSGHTYTDDDLRGALDDPDVDGYVALCERLGLQPLSNTYRRLRDRATTLGLEIPKEWSKRGPRGPQGSGPRSLEPFTDVERIGDAAPSAPSLAAILRELGETVNSRNYERLRLTIEEHGIDLSGMPPPKTRGGIPARPLDELLVRGRRVSSTALRKRLLREGIKDHRCELCGLDAWGDHPIPLELDHIDGDRSNNTLGNLRLLCPNCHALTPTYRGRNIGNGGSRPSSGS